MSPGAIAISFNFLNCSHTRSLVFWIQIHPGRCDDGFTGPPYKLFTADQIFPVAHALTLSAKDSSSSCGLVQFTEYMVLCKGASIGR